jgi:hypothetical protein
MLDDISCNMITCAVSVFETGDCVSKLCTCYDADRLHAEGLWGEEVKFVPVYMVTIFCTL